MKRQDLWLKAAYLTAPAALLLFLVVLYGPVLLHLSLPDFLNGIQIVLVRVLFYIFRFAALLGGAVGVVLNLVRLCRGESRGRSAVLILLGALYAVVGLWTILLEMVLGV